MTPWIEGVALGGGIVGGCLALWWLLIRRPTAPRQSIKLTSKRHAEFLDDERH